MESIEDFGLKAGAQSCCNEYMTICEHKGKVIFYH